MQSKSNKAFNGDRYLEKSIAGIVKKYKVKIIIETGTYLGHSTKIFSGFTKSVHTIENNRQFIKLAMWNCRNSKNITFYPGNSPVILKKILKTVKGPILFYLDAHWFNYWPILDELKVIAQYGNKNSI